MSESGSGFDARGQSRFSLSKEHFIANTLATSITGQITKVGMLLLFHLVMSSCINTVQHSYSYIQIVLQAAQLSTTTIAPCRISKSLMICYITEIDGKFTPTKSYKGEIREKFDDRASKVADTIQLAGQHRFWTERDMAEKTDMGHWGKRTIGCEKMQRNTRQCEQVWLLKRKSEGWPLLVGR